VTKLTIIDDICAKRAKEMSKRKAWAEVSGFLANILARKIAGLVRPFLGGMPALALTASGIVMGAVKPG